MEPAGPQLRPKAPRCSARQLVAILALLGLWNGSCGPTPQFAPSALPGTPTILASGTATSAIPPSTLVLSVLSFEDRAHLSDLIWLRRGIPDILISQLARDPSLILVQRERLDEVFREQFLQSSGSVADESAVRLGRLVGATVLITGSYAVIGHAIRIDAHLLSVEQGTILGTAFAEGPLEDTMAVVRALVAKIAELIPGGAGHHAEGLSAVQAAPAAKENALGEALRVDGKPLEALEAFERALATDPSFLAARANYARMVRELSGADLLRLSEKIGSRRNAVLHTRILERVAGTGIEAEIGVPRVEADGDNRLTLRMPVVLRLNAAVADILTETSRALGGSVQIVEGAEGESRAIVVTLSGNVELNQQFVREINLPRRAYLRLLTKEQRTIAVYSNLQDWRLSNWLSGEKERVRLELDRVIRSEAVFPGLLPEQVALITATKLTIDPVPRERALVRVEVIEGEQSARGSIRTHPDRDITLHQDESVVSELGALIERAWNPPVSERPWDRGYLPGNERMAVVTLAIQTGTSNRVDSPRLVRSSGDGEFDRIAMDSVRVALNEWASVRGDRGLPPGLSIRLRAQFRLLKDIPALNLIESAQSVIPLVRTQVPF